MKCLPVLAAVVFGLAGPLAANDNWPPWRGPFGNGVSDSTGLPTTWSLQENIVWKTPLPSWSGGTPVVWGDRVFVTSPTKSDAPQPAAQAQEEPQGAAQGQDEPRGRGRRG